MVPITVLVPNREMTYQSSDGVHRASLNLFARVSTLTGRVVQTFETEIRSDIPDSLLQQSMKGSSITQKSMPLKTGLYRLDIVIKDTGSGDVGVVNARLAVPPFAEEKLTGSSVILADDMQPVATREIGLGQFVIGSTRVRPKLDKTFRADQAMGIYLQAYGLKVDETTHKNNATIEVEVTQGDKTVLQSQADGGGDGTERRTSDPGKDSAGRFAATRQVQAASPRDGRAGQPDAGPLRRRALLGGFHGHGGAGRGANVYPGGSALESAAILRSVRAAYCAPGGPPRRKASTV